MNDGTGSFVATNLLSAYSAVSLDTVILTRMATLIHSSWEYQCTKSSNAYTYGLVVGDINRDGFPDIVFGNTNASKPNQLMLDDATGLGFDVTNLPDGGRPYTLAVALDNIDADGHLDIVFGNSGDNLLLLNDGYANFALVNFSLSSGAYALFRR